MTDKEMLQKNVEEFSRVQDWMQLAEKDSEIYKSLKRRVGEYMSLEEQKEVAINRYVDLMRIKAYETGENKELEYQIKVAKVKLSSFGIDYSELEL